MRSQIINTLKVESLEDLKEKNKKMLRKIKVLERGHM